MRSGLSHLPRRHEEEPASDVLSLGFDSDEEGPQVNGNAPSSELDDPRWAVVSFDKIEAGGMTYSQAAALISELDIAGISGLCIVTDDAAGRTTARA